MRLFDKNIDPPIFSHFCPLEDRNWPSNLKKMTEMVKNRVFVDFRLKNRMKMFIFMFKTTQEHLWDVYILYLGIFGIFEFLDPLGGHFWAKIGHF